MRLTMTETRDGSPDGIAVNTYVAGESYDIPDRLGRIFLDEKWARRPPGRPPAEAKDMGSAPENKADEEAETEEVEQRHKTGAPPRRRNLG